MPRSTVILTAALAVLAATVAAPALAEEVSYEQHDVRSRPISGTPDHVTLDVPADWERSRLSRTSVGFFDYTAHTRDIVVDLDPLVDTARELRAEARTLRDLPRRYYREYDFRVNGPGSKIDARWVFAYRDAPTDDTWSYTSVFLIDGERLTIEGRRAQEEELREIRRHVVRSFQVVE